MRVDSDTLGPQETAGWEIFEWYGRHFLKNEHTEQSEPQNQRLTKGVRVMVQYSGYLFTLHVAHPG